MLGGRLHHINTYLTSISCFIAQILNRFVLAQKHVSLRRGNYVQIFRQILKSTEIPTQALNVTAHLIRSSSLSKRSSLLLPKEAKSDDAVCSCAFDAKASLVWKPDQHKKRTPRSVKLWFRERRKERTPDLRPR